MVQFKIFLNRLCQPTVLISIASQIATILVLFKVQVDMSIVTTIITSICSILVLLGIVSNPDTNTKGYGDDIVECSHCHKPSQHDLINGQLVCKECGCAYDGTAK